jgi:hypothetical protein
MPRYQLVVYWEDLMRLVLKKPSAYLPFLEMSLSLAASAWPAKMVSVTAELAGMCRKKSKVNTVRRRGMMNRRGGELGVAGTANA